MTRSLASQVRVGLVAFALLCLAAGAGPAIWLAYTTRIPMIAALQRERARAAAVEIDAYVEDLQRKLGYLARVRGLTDLPIDAQHELLVGLTRHHSAYELVALLDREGRVITAAAPFGGAPPGGYADSPAFRAAFREGTDFVGPVEPDPAHEVPRLTLAVPVRDRTDRIAGVLLARVDLEFLWYAVAELKVGRTGYVYVVDDRGFLVAVKGRAPGEVEPTDLSDRPFLPRLRTSGAPVGTYRGLFGEPVVGAVAPVHSAHWTLVVELPEAEAFAPVRRMLYLMAIVAGAGTLLALGLAVLFARWVVVPLRRLTAAAEQVEAGNLDVQVPVRGENELGSLAGTFNSMARRLRSLIADLGAGVAERERLLGAEREAHARGDRAARRTALLADASALLAESLEYEPTIARVARLAVPFLADWCVLDLVGEDGRIRQVAGAHADPAREPRLRALGERFPATWDGPHAAVQVLRSGRPLLLRGEAEVERYTSGPEHASLVREVGASTAMFVPLRARGRTLGVLSLASGAPDIVYGPADLLLAEELGRRMALAIDNAGLFRQAQEAVRARELFLSIASHELRTPLTPLLANTQLLRAKVQSGALAHLPREQALAIVEPLERQVQRLTSMLDQLLDLSRIAAGRLTLELEPLDLCELAREAAARFGDATARTGARIDLDLECPATGRWDRMRVEQVLSNLLSNAVKYGQGRPVEVTVRVHPERVRLTVRDRGIGIAPEDLPRIFLRFERAVTERKFRGLGLGLYITRQIVEAHGGTIAAESRLGEGSTFVVELPRTPVR